MNVLVNRARGWNWHGHSRKWEVSLKLVCSNSSVRTDFFLGIRQPSFSKCCHSWNSGNKVHLSALWGLTSAAGFLSGQCVHLPHLRGQSPPWRVVGAGWLALQMSASSTHYPATNGTLRLRHPCVDSSSLSCESSLCFKLWMEIHPHW